MVVDPAREAANATHNGNPVVEVLIILAECSAHTSPSSRPISRPSGGQVTDGLGDPEIQRVMLLSGSFIQNIITLSL